MIADAAPEGGAPRRAQPELKSKRKSDSQRAVYFGALTNRAEMAVFFIKR
jgi:hypothetical protein